jgi:hypothetical protein
MTLNRSGRGSSRSFGTPPSTTAAIDGSTSRSTRIRTAWSSLPRSPIGGQLIFRARAALRTSAGALLPMQLLRAAVLSGATDQAGSGAAATAGIAGKLGIGAIVAAGALVAGTNSVKEDATRAVRQPTAIKASVGDHRVAPVAADKAKLPSATDRRQRVVVTPRRVSPQRVSAAPQQPSAREPRGTRSDLGATGGPQPAPGGTGGTSGTGGAQPLGGDSSGQTSPTPTGRDCQTDGSRDLAPSGVSPG